MKKLILLPGFFLGLLNVSYAQWPAKYNGAGNGMDAVTGMVVDNSGNVYVTGYAYGGAATDNDYVTIKYNSGGVKQWTAKYNGPGSGSDVPNSIFVDNSGNVYVTGSSDALTGTFVDMDAATVKYNTAGVQQWAARYSGTIQRADAGNAVKVDASGNVYITGYTSVKPLGTKKFYLTIKYNSAGIQQWLQTFTGLARTNGKDDVAVGIALDGSGNVYVTGYIIAAASGYAGQKDYLTIKYNNAGVQQWTQQYNGPGNSFDIPSAIAADNVGNVVVTGYSVGSGFDYTTIKYNTSGVQQWLARYNGPASGSDIPYALALDASGNVYVTGGDQKIIYNSDFLTVKYNAAGVQQWASRYNGPKNDNDEGYALAVDGSGNVYVTGYVNGTSPSWDIATIKYNASGVQQWAKTYNGPKDSADVGNKIGVDGSGNVYVAGASTGSTSAWDYTIIKYSASGVQQASFARGSGSGILQAQPEASNVLALSVPRNFVLYQNYPNPFKGSTVIDYYLPKSSNVSIVISDALGRVVKEINNTNMPAGKYSVNVNGEKLHTGYYFYKIVTNEFTDTKRMLLIK